MEVAPEKLAALRAVIRKHWGYDTLRPLQPEAMLAAVDGRDSLVVLPTGGGKSLCYQAPALLSDRLTVVISPLIALMKDQVDRLLARGISAAFLNSSLDADDRRRVMAGIAGRQYKLIFVAPERFSGDWFYDLLARADVGSFAIDEAHCISHWGHDFRSDYRQLGRLKEWFPKASVHAFTATATPQVRDDIVTQLGLVDPVVLVGDFFRPNLVYRVVRRGDIYTDVLDRIRQHPGQAGIVYCIRRKDVDEMSAFLKSSGVKAIGYHAGMTDETRTAAQDTFAAGKADVVVATVAFGMGIDRADIRFVIHAGMPKSLEHYQQETGRAGRDGKPAECTLFYSGADFRSWQSIMEKNETADLDNQIRMLSEMYAFCSAMTCRHRKLVSYFGQPWDRDKCDACDVCMNTLAGVPDSTVIAQKVLSCVVRTGERFGAVYVSDVLRGIETEQVIQRGHDRLSTFALLPEASKGEVLGWIDQLIDQGMLERAGEYRVLKVTPKGWQVLRSQLEVTLYENPSSSTPPTRSKKRTARLKPALAGQLKMGDQVAPPVPVVEAKLDAQGMILFDRLRLLRREIADERNVPAFMVFSDKTLRAIARVRPSRQAQLLEINGVGPKKADEFGIRILKVVEDHLRLMSDD